MWLLHDKLMRLPHRIDKSFDSLSSKADRAGSGVENWYLNQYDAKFNSLDQNLMGRAPFNELIRKMDDDDDWEDDD